METLKSTSRRIDQFFAGVQCRWNYQWCQPPYQWAEVFHPALLVLRCLHCRCCFTYIHAGHTWHACRRLIGQRYQYQYGESIPCEQLVSWLCDIKQVSLAFVVYQQVNLFLSSGLHPVWRKEALRRFYPLHGLGQALWLPIGNGQPYMMLMQTIWSSTLLCSTSPTPLAIMVDGRQLALATTGMLLCPCWNRSTRCDPKSSDFVWSWLTTCVILYCSTIRTLQVFYNLLIPRRMRPAYRVLLTSVLR